MFRKLIHNRKAQNTAEYALLIALVVAAIIAMQTYAQRGLQARVRDTSDYVDEKWTTDADGQSIFSGKQYEPYYLQSNYQVSRDTNETQILGNHLVSKDTKNVRTRDINGFQLSTYNESGKWKRQ